MSAEFDISDIIIRSFKKNLTEEEQAFLDVWKSESRENRLEYLDYETIWKELGRLSKPVKVNLPRSLSETRSKAGINSSKINWKVVLMQAAAVMLLAVLFNVTYHYLFQKNVVHKAVNMAFQEVKANYKTQTRLELTDGTTVFLNSGSTLRFPLSFSGLDKRMVQLTGEGFFIVAENKDQPFVVDINSLLISVTGTRFNVDAYPGNRKVTVALDEGEVVLQKETAKEINDLVVMKPGEVVAYDLDRNKMRIFENQNLNKYIAWTEGKILFYDDPIRTVVEKLENWYNVDIEIADKRLECYRFTGTFFDEPLTQVLYLLSISSRMEYTVIPAKKMENNSYSKRKIILRSKRT